MPFPFASWRNTRERAVTVLVADDNVAVLNAVSRLLSSDFDLVATVTDGRRALEASLQLNADVTVLDLSMPVLDGFQVTRELKRAGSRSKVVMLTMLREEAYVVAAIECGAHGFVAKTRMHWDLASAIEHAMEGRLFVPFLAPLLDAVPVAGTAGHALQLWANDRASFDASSRVVNSALRRGDLVAVVATEAMRAGIAERLIASGWDLGQAAARGNYISFDAALSLSEVIVSGRVDVDRLTVLVHGIERTRLSGSFPHVTIVGDMSALLHQNGSPHAAIDLEQTWDTMAQELPFLTVCNHSMESLREPEFASQVPSLYAAHSAICHAHGG